jgi:hypothetical protein
MPSNRPSKASYFGKYRGQVVDNADPKARGRLRVKVPEVLGAKALVWAEACLPPQNGLAPILPAIGDTIWVEFESGDATRPIWVGTLWPQAGATPMEIKLTTTTGATLILGPGGVTLRNGTGASIQLQGPRVSVNGGALEVL